MGIDYATSTQAGGGRCTGVYILAGGILGMMVTMGIGRFAYTPIIPVMERDLGISHSLAGSIASLNYLGYLAGAIGCSFFPALLRNRVINVIALLASIATTLLMGLTVSPATWGLLRFCAGWASAVLFVLISVEVAEALAVSGQLRWGGMLYGGIGLGMVLSGLAVPFMDRLDGWRGCWLGMGALAAALALTGIGLARKRSATTHIPDAAAISVPHCAVSRQLAAAYFFEGLGYIVSATFLVTMIARTPGLERYASLSWVAVGLAATPSTMLWQATGRRFGIRQALVGAYAIQAAGIFLSINASTAVASCVAAVTFGGTFLGIVTMVMTEGSRRAGPDSPRMAAILTACFSAGQVIGPPIAGRLADGSGSFTVPLLLAGGAVVIGGVLVAIDRDFPPHRA